TSEEEEPESGSNQLPPRPAAPLRSYPADSSARDIVTERRLILVSDLGFVRRLTLIAFAKALPTQKEDLGVFYQAIGDGRRDRRVVKDIAPFRKCSIGCSQRAPLMTVPSGDDLVEEVGGLLIQRKIA